MAISEHDQITNAWAGYRIWEFGNEILYRLCADHPAHSEDHVIIAKMWLVGRAYAAAVERRRASDGLSSDDFYIERLAPTVRKSEIDTWFQKLREDRSRSKWLTLDVHKRLVDLLKPITRLEKRSFASKYLHFHFLSPFFPLRCASRGERSDICGEGRGEASDADVDRVYADFFDRCEEAGHRMADRDRTRRVLRQEK